MSDWFQKKVIMVLDPQASKLLATSPVTQDGVNPSGQWARGRNTTYTSHLSITIPNPEPNPEPKPDPEPESNPEHNPNLNTILTSILKTKS